jgi:hypothetical protein
MGKGKPVAEQAEKSGFIVMTEDMAHDLVKEAGKEAAKKCMLAMEQERIKADKKKKDQQYKMTKDMLKSYRREKIRIADEAEFTEEEMAERRWAFLEDLIENPSGDGKMNDMIPDYERKRRESKYTIWLIENALRLYEYEANEYGNEVDKRRLAEMKALYIDDEKYDVQELADIHSIAERVVYKDIGIATKIMMVYLFGAP